MMKKKINLKNNLNKWHYGIIISLFVLSLISIMLSFTSISLLESFRIVFGSVYVLFIPGFLISFIFFSTAQIDWLERIALSFALSIAIVPLIIFYTNLVGISISATNSFFTILGIIIISCCILYYKKNI